MDIGRVVAGLDRGGGEAAAEFGGRGARQRSIVAGPAKGQRAADVGGHRGEIAGGIGEVAAEPGERVAQLRTLHEGDAALRHKHPAGGQTTLAVREKGGGE